MLSHDDVDKLLFQFNKNHRRVNSLNGILRKLVDSLNNNVDGDVVELGCNSGETSYWIQVILNLYNSNKKLHVYDSWLGVPDKVDRDKLKNEKDIVDQVGGSGAIRPIAEQILINETYWKRGSCQCGIEEFYKTFKTNNENLPIIFNGKIVKMVDLPIIHSGWFKDIPDELYPEKICFAFFDGDLYSSIMDSFEKVFHKCVKDSIIVIDDCGDNTLVGVKNACVDFLADKKEKLHLDAYPDLNGNWDRTNNLHSCFWGGWIKKL